jgi:hypothetical protein
MASGYPESTKLTYASVLKEKARIKTVSGSYYDGIIKLMFSDWLVLKPYQSESNDGPTSILLSISKIESINLLEKEF